MKRFTMLLLSLTMALALVGVVSAQSADPSAGAGSKGQASQPNTPAKPEQSTPPAVAADPVPATTPAATEAAPSASAVTKATPKPNPALDAVRTKAQKTSPKELADVNKDISTSQNEVEAEATAKGDATVAGRIAGEFGLTTDALVAERNQFGRGWGELMIAHTLAANATTGVTVADILQLRAEGFGWGQIAHGMDFKLGEVTSAVKAETKVATGLAKADGKSAMIRGVKGAEVKAQATTKGGRVKEGGTPASVGVGVGAGTKVETGKAGNK